MCWVSGCQGQERLRLSSRGTSGQTLDPGRAVGGKAKAKAAPNGNPAPKGVKGGTKGADAAPKGKLAPKGAKGGAKADDAAAPKAKRKRK